MITPRVVDLFHGDVMVADAHKTDPVGDFSALKQAGIWGLIHKATQGLGVNDPAYAVRVSNARSAGLLTGSYHYNTGDTVQGQINHFFDATQPDNQTIMALDFEDNRASQMTLAQAVQFLQLGDERLGRPLWLYSGNRIKTLITNASAEVRAVLGKRPFWLAEYGPIAKMLDDAGKPLPWVKPTLHQFTGDGVGPMPHALPGILTQGIDINSYAGTLEQLKSDWCGLPFPKPVLVADVNRTVTQATPVRESWLESLLARIKSVS
jgi:lysozyme